MTPDAERRARRALAAAQTKFQAGALDDALGLLATAETGGLSDLQRAQVDLLRAETVFVATHGSDAPPLLLEAARRLSGLDPALARETYLEALSAAMFAGRLAGPGAGVLEVAQAARAAPAPPHAPRAPDLLLDGLATLFSEGYEAAVPILRRAHSAFDAAGMSADRAAALEVAGDHVVRASLGRRALGGALGAARPARPRDGRARRAPARAQPARLRPSLRGRADRGGVARRRDPRRRRRRRHRSRALRRRGTRSPCEAARPRPPISSIAAAPSVTRRGEGVGLSVLDWAEAVLYNGLGRYEDARAAALRVVEHPHDLGASNWGMAELIEAAVRAGTPELAADALRRLVDTTAASGTDWALGLAARSRALLARRPGRRGPLRGGDRPARANADGGRSRPRPPPLRRVAATRTPTRGRTQAAADRPRPLLRLRDGGVRRARAGRAAGDRRARPQTDRRRRSTSSPRRSRRSHASRRRATPTARSPLSCSSARARSSTTCARRSASST